MAFRNEELLPQIPPQAAIPLAEIVRRLMRGAAAKNSSKAKEQLSGIGQDPAQLDEPGIQEGIGLEALGFKVPDELFMAMIKPPKQQQQQAPQRSIQDILASLSGRIPPNNPDRGIVPGQLPPAGGLPGGVPGIGVPPGGGLPGGGLPGGGLPGGGPGIGALPGGGLPPPPTLQV